MRIALFVTCLADALFPEVGKATVRLLERLGHEVVFPPGQTCCGQMHINTGYQSDALPLVRRHVEVFEPYEAIVAPSGSCVGSVRHQHATVARRLGEDALAERAAAVAARTYELSEFLVDVLGVEDVGAYFQHRVTYHRTCHSLRMLRVGDKPLRLLRNVRGMELVELPDADHCCGFGGTFAMKNADTSTAMLADKMRHVLSTGAEVATAAEGNGRMCLTLPQTLITVLGIEKLVPTWADLEVFLQLLPRSSTGERMNPYTSAWTGVTPGDGSRAFRLVLLDNGRTATLADEVGREALHCIRCSACLNVCPVYQRTGGHAYGSVYAGPIGAVLTPQLTGVEDPRPGPHPHAPAAAVRLEE